MGYTKEQLLARLQELEIECSLYDHPAVLTVEAQEQYVGHLKGALSKNLFLKDKKQRFYVVSALKDTKVDLKVLSQRLGLGKGGLRMAPEGSLGVILQVPLGCVTPFALINESARHVSLLLDQGFRSQECCFFHPLRNDVTISLAPHNLDKFLKSIEKGPKYVDLEANPSVGKDQPPDLADLVPSEAIILPDSGEKEVETKLPENDISVNKKATTVPAKKTKPSSKVQKEKETNNPFNSSDSEKFIEEILEKTSAIILSEIKSETTKQNGEQQIGAILSNIIRNRHLTSDLKSLAATFKSTVYTEGFVAGTQSQPKRM